MFYKRKEKKENAYHKFFFFSKLSINFFVIPNRGREKRERERTFRYIFPFFPSSSLLPVQKITHIHRGNSAAVTLNKGVDINGVVGDQISRNAQGCLDRFIPLLIRFLKKLEERCSSIRMNIVPRRIPFIPDNPIAYN